MLNVNGVDAERWLAAYEAGKKEAAELQVRPSYIEQR